MADVWPGQARRARGVRAVLLELMKTIIPETHYRDNHHYPRPGLWGFMIPLSAQSSPTVNRDVGSEILSEILSVCVC